jgi:hypothetical protein
MKRIELACYCLIASAMVLGGIVLFKAADHVQNQAMANMIVTKDMVTIMSARVDQDKEMLYVLDNKNAQLLGYLIDPNKKRIELMATFDVESFVQQGLAATSGNTGGRTRPGR